MERENIRRLTHDDMKNHLLTGDKIDETTRGDQEDFEIDRQVGGDQMDFTINNADPEAERDEMRNSTDSLVELPHGPIDIPRDAEGRGPGIVTEHDLDRVRRGKEG